MRVARLPWQVRVGAVVVLVFASFCVQLLWDVS
jgi:hypothetical protein